MAELNILSKHGMEELAADASRFIAAVRRMVEEC
jgi:hypothetical protein